LQSSRGIREWLFDGFLLTMTSSPSNEEDGYKDEKNDLRLDLLVFPLLPG
jgi:hypothetical protein